MNIAHSQQECKTLRIDKITIMNAYKLIIYLKSLIIVFTNNSTVDKTITHMFKTTTAWKSNTPQRMQCFVRIE